MIALFDVCNAFPRILGASRGARLSVKLVISGLIQIDWPEASYFRREFINRVYHLAGVRWVGGVLACGPPSLYSFVILLNKVYQDYSYCISMSSSYIINQQYIISSERITVIYIYNHSYREYVKTPVSSPSGNRPHRVATTLFW